MGSLINTDEEKSIDKISSIWNTIPFEIEAPKKINYDESDILMIDLADLVDLKPIEISEREKFMTEIFLEKLCIDLDSNITIDITTNPFELACFYLMILRSIK